MKKVPLNKTVFSQISIGLQLALTVIVFIFAGKWLDDYFDKSPLFLITGMFIGMGIGFYFLMKELFNHHRDDDKVRDDKTGKWM